MKKRADQSGARLNGCQIRLHAAVEGFVWNVLDKKDPSPRHGLYRSLHELLRPLAQVERVKVLDDLVAWAGAERMGRPSHRAVSVDELLSLAEGELVEIGAHTVTHAVLSALPVSTQREEVQRSKADLEEILGHTVTSFAYPYGTRSDYTAETITLVREAGFAYACSNFPGVIGRDADMFQLPRVLVRDWDGDEFARRLGEWVHG